MKQPSEQAQASRERFVTANTTTNGDSTSADFTGRPQNEIQNLMAALKEKIEISNLAVLCEGPI